MADVSQSTFFRYFPTKEEVVLHDRYDPLLLADFLAQPAELSPIAELRARALDQLASTLEPFNEAVAARTGRRVDDPAVRALTGAVIGVSMAAMLSASSDPDADYVEVMDAALAQLEAGLRS